MGAHTTLVDSLNSELTKLDLAPLNSEQVDCLLDPARLEEAAGMLDDLHVRCGVRLPLPAGQDVGTVHDDQEDARQEAAGLACHFDALCIEELATDDTRAYGGAEYRLVGYTGPDAPLAAACHPSRVGLWVAGREIDVRRHDKLTP